MSLLDKARAAIKGVVPTQPEVVADRERARMERLDAPTSMGARAAEHAAWVDHALAPARHDDYRTRQTLFKALAETLRAGTAAQQQAAVGRSIAHVSGAPRSSSADPEFEVLRVLRARKLPWTADEVAWMLNATARPDGLLTYFRLTSASVALTAASRLPESDLPLLAPALEKMIASARADGDTADAPKLVARAQALLDQADPVAAEELPAGALADDTFGPAALAHLAEHHDRATVAATLRHLTAYGNAVTPTKKWLTVAAELRGAHPGSVDVCVSVLDLVAVHREAPYQRRQGTHTYTAIGFISGQSAAVVRGAAWVLARDDATDADVATLGRAATRCGTGFGGSGGQARCPQVTSSAVAVLERIATTQPHLATPVVAALSGVLDKVANKSLRTSIGKALDGVAAAAGLTHGQLLERAVPTFELSADGTGQVPAGGYSAVLALEHGPAGAKLVTTWRTPDGKTVKTVPAAVRAQHGDVVAGLKATTAQVKKVAATQRQRLEELLAVQRTWSGDEWAGYYPAHPVVGLCARTLIWQVAPTGDADQWFSGLPTPVDDTWGLVSHDGTVHPVGDTDKVRLWHPIRQPLDDIKGWRAHLTDTGVRQPFKQAFREIYLLTPAEEVTDTYSNRFAAHILRYPQAGALIRGRGWAGQHLGYWDGGYEATATKELGEEGWRAAFDYSLVERDEDGYERVSLAATDQVRFERLANGRWTPQHLRDVPPLVFSEAMRDVDLFVGVTSISSDPTWNDRGTANHRDYWHQASFGDLTESAQMRREALERLLPRTTLAGRVELEKNFLRVHGHLRDYRIHLGSTNILMSPADTYLCIFPARGGKDPKVFLPFEEGGGKLSVILSKAFLLAEDTAITDPSITHQLRNGLT